MAESEVPRSAFVLCIQRWSLESLATGRADSGTVSDSHISRLLFISRLLIFE